MSRRTLWRLSTVFGLLLGAAITVIVHHYLTASTYQCFGPQPSLEQDGNMRVVQSCIATHVPPLDDWSWTAWLTAGLVAALVIILLLLVLCWADIGNVQFDRRVWDDELDEYELEFDHRQREPMVPLRAGLSPTTTHTTYDDVG